MDWKAAYLLTDIAVLLIATSFERVPAEVAMFTALLALWIPGILDTKTALAGWSNGGLMTVIALFIVVGGVQKLPLISRLAAWAFGDPRRTNPRIALLKQILVVAALSIFINNTPLVALFIPIVLDWCRTYRVSPSRYLLPLSYAAIMGDLSVIGTSTSLVAQGLILQRNLPPMSFFDIAYVGAPALAAGALYLTTIGYNLLPGAAPSAQQATSEDEELAAAETDFVLEMLIPAARKAAAGEPGSASGQAEGSPTIGTSTTSSFLTLRSKAAAPFSPASLAGQPVAVKLAQIFSGDATALRILRRQGAAASEGAEEYAVIEPVTADEVFREGDRVIVRSPPAAVAQAFTHAEHHGFSFRAVDGGAAARVPNRDSRRYQSYAAWAEKASAWLQSKVGSSSSSSSSSSAEAALATAPLAASASQAGTAAGAPSHSRVPYELLLSNSNAFLGSRVGNGLLEEAYGVTLIGYRPAISNPAARRLPVALKAQPAAAPAAELVAVSVAVAEGEAPSVLLPGGQAALPPTAAGGADAAALAPSDAIYHAGDSVLVTGPKDLLDAPSRRRDFFASSPLPGVASVEREGWSQYGSLALLIAMFVIGSIGYIGSVPFEMEKAAMMAACFNLLFGFVKPKEIYTLIQWDLVILIGASFGLGAAMDSTGLAKLAAGWVVGLKAGAHGSLFLLYGITLLLTEIISNNAAVTLAIPIAASMAKQLGVNSKPFLLATTIASTAAFAVPLGYQTHLMVLGPGGYTNLDFFKVGFLMDLIYWAVIAGLSPVIWPF